MQTLKSIIFIAIIPMGYSLKIPKSCRNANQFQSKTCCIFPPFFEGATAKKCGAVTSYSYVNSKTQMTVIRRHTFTGCEFWKCLLETYALTSGKYVDQKSYFVHLDTWVSSNTDFTEVMRDAQKHCSRSFKNEFPIPICDFYLFNTCIRNYIVTDCPKYVDTPECKVVKNFYDECQSFLI